MQQVSPDNSRMEKFTGGCMKAVATVLFCILFYLFFHGFFVTDQADFVQGNLEKVSRAGTVFVAFALVGSLFVVLKKGLFLLNEKQLKRVMSIAFLGMVILQSICICSFRSMYLWDGAFVVGGANSLLETGEISQDAFYYLSVYKNQHPFVVVTAFFLWVGKLMSLSTGGQYLLLNFVNLISMDVAIFFFVKMAGYLLRNEKEKDKRVVQCGLLLLFVLNPFVYVLAGYYYTIFLSLSFFAGGMYFTCKALSGKKSAVIWAGIIFAGGYALRATTIIPVVATVITAVLVAMIKGDVKRFFAGLGIAVGALVLGVFLCSGAERVVGIDTKDSAFPTTHWIMMSLTAPGCHNEADEAFTASFPTKEEKSRAVEERLVEKVRALGPKGMAELMLVKLNYTWESGNHAYSFFTGNCIKTDGVYDVIYGSKKDIVALYGQGYYLVLIGCSMLTILRVFFVSGAGERKRRGLMFFFCVTLLGGFLFYLLWETGAQYSLVFFPLFFLLSAFSMFMQGNEAFQMALTKKDEGDKKISKQQIICRLKMAAGGIVFLVFVCLWWNCREVFTSQVNSNTDTSAIQLLANHPYEVKEDEIFVQEIQSCQDFNQMIFQFRNFMSEENSSIYEVRLYRNQTEEQSLVWKENIVAKGQPQNGAFIKEFQTLPEGKYRLEIEKTAGSEGHTLSFVTYKMGGYDAYTVGKCMVNQEEQPVDMIFGLYQKSDETYTTMFRYTLLLLVFFMYFLFWEICCILKG